MKLTSNNHVGPAFAMFGGSKDYRWHEKPEESFRKAGFADEILPRLRHKGWYVDDYQDDTTRGVVFTLSSGRGFLAACTDPHNDGPVVFDSSRVLDTKEDAAKAADDLARRYAELCQEDNAKELERIRAEESEQERLENEQVNETLVELCNVE